MSKLELIHHLYGYNEWANEKLLDAAANVPDEQLFGTNIASFGNALTCMAHIAGSQIVWLSRWREGQNPVSVLGTQDKRTLAEVRQLFASSHTGLREYLSTLTEADVEGILAYRDSAGSPYERALWQLMTHVVNHGTYHRGEVAGALSGLGHSPGDMDFTFWEREREDFA